MIINPRGYGKSALMMEMAYKRDEICKRNDIPSGPVLFTDFEGIKSASDAEKRMLEKIQPLFFNMFSFLYKNSERGSTSAAFLIFSILIAYLAYVHIAIYYCQKRNYRIN
jgi:hypothetical protein